MSRKAKGEPSISTPPKTVTGSIKKTRTPEFLTGEDKYRGFIENLPVLFYAVNPKSPFTPFYVSPAFERFGYPIDDWLNDPEIWVRVIHEDDRAWVFKQTTSSTRSGDNVDYEYRIVDAWGEIHWVRDCGCLIRNKKGQVVCREGVMLDITDHKLAQQELQKREKSYRTLAHSIPRTAVLLFDHDFRYTLADGEQLARHNFSQEMFEGKTLWELFPPEIANEYADYYRRALAGEEVSLENENEDGCFQIYILPVKDEKDEIFAGMVMWQDITERKKAEEDLKLSEVRYRNLFENATDIIYVHDLDGNYISLNQAAERVLGYPREEVLRMNMKEIVAPEHLEIARERLAAKIAGADKTIYEMDCIDKEGNRVTVEVNSSPVYKDGVPVAVQGIARDITDRKLAQEAILENEEKYRDLFENANDLIYTHDLRGNFTSLNRAGERITGYSREEALTMNITEVVAPESLAAAREMTARKIAGDDATTYEIDIVSKDGRYVSLELSTRLINRKGVPIGVQGLGRDITERKRSEDALKTSEQRYRQLGEGIFHHVWTAEPDGRLDYVNARTLDYFQRTGVQMIGEGWQDVVHPDDLGECLRRWTHSIETGDFYDVEFRLLRHDGVYRWHKARATSGLDADGNIVKWFGTNTDIDEQKQGEEKLNYFARHDPLTDLPNRAEFMGHLRSAVERAESNPVARFAVLFLDLDRFKLVNDSLGHLVGDKLLRSIADRLRKYVRPGDVVARLGGDEFTILLNRTGGVPDVVQIAERVQRNLAKPFQIDSYELFTSASIGIIVSDDIMREPEDFLRDADAAMYRAKEAGKARYEIFDREMHVRNINLLQIETDLRHAIERSEFEVQYQPIVKLESGSTREFEALIRWRHPKRGLLGPDEFVSVAEETGMIVPIGGWILEEACRQTVKWQDQFAFPLSISVNLSAKQLMHPSLTEQVAAILRETGLNPRQLKLEVTESNVMEHSEKSLSVLQTLDSLGVSLSTDDFGTGYSSLSYLQRFPFDRLKIDRSFVDKMCGDKKSEAIVKTILMLGENLGIEVVAEGIETERQLEMLRRLGCRLGQGYLFSKPVGAKGVEKLLRDATEKFDFEGSVRPINSVDIIDASVTDRLN